MNIPHHFEAGTLAKSTEVNDNFNYVAAEIESRSQSIIELRASMNSQFASTNAAISELSESINDQIEEGISGEVADIQKYLNFKKPTMTPLIDWENMAFKANVADVRNINNQTTGIKAYGGDYGLLHSGDIYLTEDFTNYSRIMVVWTDDSGALLNATIIETWLLDHLLNSSKGRTSLINQQYAANYYWGVYGYNYTYTQSNVTYKTDKQYFLCNGQQNCGIVEIYGLTYEDEEEE